MYGHLPLIDMRKQGEKPKIVFINDFHCQQTRDWHNPGERYSQVWRPDHPTVSTAGDPIETADLRFVVGLTVSISGEDLNRTQAIFEACKEAGAYTVAAGCGNWSEVWRREVKHV